MTVDDDRRDEFIEQTLKVWQPRVDRELSFEDARDIATNVAGFFRLLLEWDAAKRDRKDTSTDKEAGRVDLDEVA